MRWFDVVINGGGLCGSALALGLAREGWRVAMVEPNPPRVQQEGWEERVFAFTPRAWGWLEQLEVPLPRAERVQEIAVGDEKGIALRFQTQETTLPYLAMVAEAERVRAAIWQAIEEQSSAVRVVTEGHLQMLRVEEEGVEVALTNGEVWGCRLVVGAEGRGSWVRETAKIASEVVDYGQVAVVANLACSRDHQGVAYQWFRSDGVVALLPLPGRFVSLVWSTATASAPALLSEEAEAFAERVTAASGEVVGRLQMVTPRAGFRLSWLRCERVVGKRVALVGDAAHGIHPLSGHGVNLGLNDAAELARAIGRAGEGDDPGDGVALARYARWRATEPLLLQTATHLLAWGFGWEDEGVARLRRWGLRLVNRLPMVKRHLIRYAALGHF
ncbi:MAG: FAD-dependent monooxygenase [Hydrogenophilus sp.]|nr:FAD-dependent monooxygenase [Hydrogenophilus sp.]